MGFTENEIAVMYLSKHIRLLRDIKKEQEEIEERRRFEEEQAEIRKLECFGDGM